ncbi:hypothetical protein JHD49_04180 [Sulfurimonas sp. SAG-AH-194-C21]|nr:hypothetical protein [Sulfurimonas sp. SAG-AH-194-C21]MDF1883129.1 hypothetical protein [Sulfurimonas sp. SAG-AH-194-C21]
MDVNSVPQDDSSTYAKNKKAIYASDENGNVSVVASSGWEVEEAATKQALSDLEESAKQAYTLVKNGEMSPLYFHMYAVRMDLQVLSESTGFFKWTIKKDFDPSKFSNIKDKRMAVYAEAMGKSQDELKILPKGLYE